jgi:LytS/YehU family sensor histidine kinase
MLTTFVADELAVNRARAWPLYAVAIVVGAATGALLQWELHRLLALPPRTDVESDPGDVATAQRAFLFFEYLTWGGIVVWIYVSRRAQTRAEARMTAAQLQRAETQRRTISTRLQTLQAQVEPQFLQRTLARVCDRYQIDSAEGSEMLGRLIVYLRAALPQLRESASTLAREVELVRAYVDVIRLPREGDVPLDANIPEDLSAVRMPPMVMLPLISQVLLHRNTGSAGSPAIRISANRAASMLRLEITAEPARFDTNDEVGGLAAIRERVHALYGSNGSIAFERVPREGVRAIIEIPHETADGNHR